MTERDAFKRLYEQQDRAALARAGREHLDQDLRLRSRKLSRAFWILWGAIIAAVVLASALVLIHVLRRADGAAAGFHDRRMDALERYQP